LPGKKLMRTSISSVVAVFIECREQGTACQIPARQADLQIGNA
jgi:hypothetical protein